MVYMHRTLFATWNRLTNDTNLVRLALFPSPSPSLAHIYFVCCQLSHKHFHSLTHSPTHPSTRIPLFHQHWLLGHLLHVQDCSAICTQAYFSIPESATATIASESRCSHSVSPSTFRRHVFAVGLIDGRGLKPIDVEIILRKLGVPQVGLGFRV